MPEKQPRQIEPVNPYDAVSILKASELDADRNRRKKKRGNNKYVLPSGTTVLYAGSLRADPTIRVELGTFNIVKPVEVNLSGSGTSTQEGLDGENLGFFNLGIGTLTKDKGRDISELERFYYSQDAVEDHLNTDLDAKKIGNVVFTVKLHGQLDLH